MMMTRFLGFVVLLIWLAALGFLMWRLRRANPPLPDWRRLLRWAGITGVILALVLLVRLPLRVPFASETTGLYVPWRHHLYPLIAVPWLIATLLAGQMAGTAVAFATGLALLFGAHEGFWVQPLVQVTFSQGTLGLWLFARRRRWGLMHTILFLTFGLFVLVGLASLGQGLLWLSSTMGWQAESKATFYGLVLWDWMLWLSEILLAVYSWMLVIWFRQLRRSRSWFEALLKPPATQEEFPVAEAFFRHQFLPALFTGSIVLALLGFYAIENVLQVREMEHLAELSHFVQSYVVTLDQEVQRRMERIYRQIQAGDLDQHRLVPFLQNQLQSDPLFASLAYWDVRTQRLVGVTRTSESFAPLSKSEKEALEAVTRYSFGRPLWIVYSPSSDAPQDVLSVLWAPNDAQPEGVLLARLRPRLNTFFLPMQTLFDTLPQSGIVGSLLHRDQNQVALVSRGYEEWLGMTLPLAQEREAWVPMTIRGQVYWAYLAPASWSSQIAWRPAFFLQHERFLRLELWALAGTLAFSGLAGLIALVIGMRYFDRLHAELHHLEAHARWLAQGHFERPVQGGTLAETHQVMRAFESMRKRLQAYVDGLQRLLNGVLGLQRLGPYDQPAIPRLLRETLAPAALGACLVADARLWDPDAPPGTFHSWVAGPRGEALSPYAKLYFREGLSKNSQLWTTQGPKNLTTLAVGLYDNTEYLGVLVMTWPKDATPEYQGPYLKTLAAQWQTTLARWRLLQQQENEQQRLQALLDALPLPLVFVDEEGRVRWRNRQASALWPHALFLSIWEHCRPEREGEIGPRSVQWQQQRYECYVLPLPAIPGVVDLNEYALVLLAPREDAYQAQLRTHLMVAIGTELRTSLSFIQGYLGMLESVGELSDQQRNLLTKLRTLTERLSRRIAALVSMGRVDLDHVQTPVRLAELLHGLQDAIEPLARQRRIRFRVHYDPQAPSEIHADSDLLYLALYQVLDNALKFTHSGGEVTLLVQADPHAQMVRFVVSDTGAGIATVDLQRLQALLSNPAAMPSQESAPRGLGLLLVRSVAQLHGGRVLIDSQLGQGTTVILELPFRPPEGKAGDQDLLAPWQPSKCESEPWGRRLS
ncbi:MAG: HAMP domain-containing histidine kinase [Chloroflexi bacterium]|nr:HAMP domain-containing histidine kinase [Chloroflexota bacterium]